MKNRLKAFLTVFTLLATLFPALPALSADREDFASSSLARETVAGQIRDAVEEKIAEMLGSPSLEWEISEIKIPNIKKIPEGFEEIKVETRNNAIRGNRVSFIAKFMGNSQVLKRLNVYARIKTFAKVVVSKDTLERGTVIVPNMVSLERRAVSLPLANLCTDVAQVDGHIAGRKLVSGKAIKKTEVFVPPDVKAGEVVMIVAENTNVRITAKGIAKEDGVIGEMIPVINLRSKKRVFAKISDSSTVKVIF